MKLSIMGALFMLLLWVVLAFVLQFESGWVHVPLALCAVLLARAIILSDDTSSETD